ncbi:MAG: response regulator transcription factor [Sphingomonas bacterium]|nr:response regulator transcription factor [Sphingomonas bacterium]
MNILYIEDDPRAAAALADIVAAGGDRLVWEASGESGLRQAASDAFDVIILDRMLPDLDGLAIVARLRAAGNDTPILMLSALARSENRVEGLDAGVDDYLAKPFEAHELIARVKALNRRATNRVHGAVILFGAFECHVKSRTAFRDGEFIALSPREFELFRYFMENAGEIVTRAMLLRDVWGMNFDPQTNVVDVNIGRLRRKLEIGTAMPAPSPALETIWGSGYRLTNGETRQGEGAGPS